MNDPANWSGNVERFTGFAADYDAMRPAPPPVLGELLGCLAGVERPALVVDLGCGTGLSTRYWADRAERVVGVDPTPDMRLQARARTAAPNVAYREGFSHDTGLESAVADVVTACQALHWMEPQATFEEVARILRPGGVFAACDYDWPPCTGCWRADALYERVMARIHALEAELPDPAPPLRWRKEQHLARLAASRCFRYTHEVLVHSREAGDADRLVGLLLSQGGVQTLLKAGHDEATLGLDTLRADLRELLGDEPRPWLWSARVRLGVV